MFLLLLQEKQTNEKNGPMKHGKLKRITVNLRISPHPPPLNTNKSTIFTTAQISGDNYITVVI